MLKAGTDSSMVLVAAWLRTAIFVWSSAATKAPPGESPHFPILLNALLIYNFVRSLSKVIGCIHGTTLEQQMFELAQDKAKIKVYTHPMVQALYETSAFL